MSSPLRYLLCFVLLLLILFVAHCSSQQQRGVFGRPVAFNVTSGHQTRMHFARDQATSPEHTVHPDEVVRVQINSVGKRGHRPIPSTPAWGSIRVGRNVIRWQLPWWQREDRHGPMQQHLQLLTCDKEDDSRSVMFTAETNASSPLTLQWKVTTENVVLFDNTHWRSNMADVVYRRYRWPDGVVELDVELLATRGVDECASLLLLDACTTKPYQFERPLLTFNFTAGVKIRVRRHQWTGDLLWLYLLPQWNPDFCTESFGRQPHNNQKLPSKTVRVKVMAHQFHTDTAGGFDDSGRAAFRTSQASLQAVPSSGSWSTYEVPAGVGGTKDPVQCRARHNMLRQQIRDLEAQCPAGA